MGGGTSTSEQQSTSSDPKVTSTLDTLLGGVGSAYSDGPTFTGAGPTTTGSWQSSLTAAANPAYAAGVNGALTNQAATAAGQNIGTSDPTYEALRTKDANDALQTVNNSFNNSGLFGSDSNGRAAGEGVTNALDTLDYAQYQNGQQQQQQAITNLPSLFAALQAPSATASAVGSAQDANTQGAANSKLSLLAQLSSILGGTAGVGGTTTTATSPATPLWQSLLGLGVAAL